MACDPVLSLFVQTAPRPYVDRELMIDEEVSDERLVISALETSVGHPNDRRARFR